MANYLEKLASVESSGNPRAKAKTSSATGLFQMTRGTFDGLKKNNPQLAGITWEQHSADPAIQKQFVDALTVENDSSLKRGGFEATDLNRYLAHFAGASGASKLLKSDPGALAKDVLGEAASKANAGLITAKTTVSDLLATFDRKLNNVGKPRTAMAASPPAAAPIASAGSGFATSQSPMPASSLQDAMASLDKGRSVANTRVLTPTANSVLAGQPIAAKSGGMIKIKPVEKYQIKKYAAGGKMPWEKSASEFGEPAAASTVASTAETAAPVKMPWERSASDFGEPTATKVVDVKEKAKAQAQADSGVNKVSDFLGKTFSGAAKALNVRPQQVEGNVLTGMKIREKTPEEEKLGPTRAAERARFWASTGQGALVDTPVAVAQLFSPEGGAADQAINAQQIGYDKLRANLGGEGFDLARLGGNVASPFAIKGAGAVDKLLNKTSSGLVRRGALQGTLGGVLQPVVQTEETRADLAKHPEFGSGFWGDKALQVGTGAVAGGALSKLLGKGIVPEGGGGIGIPGSDVERFREKFPEVPLTWGQLLGPRANLKEQGATSWPYIGNIIKEGRERSLNAQNVGMMNRALQDAGLKLDKGTKGGRHMFDEAYHKLTSAYDNVLDDVSLSDPQALRAKIYGKMDDAGESYTPGVISQKYQSLSEAGQNRFDKIMESGLFSKFGKDPKGNHAIAMDGNKFKGHEEDLKDTIDSLMNGGGEEREIGKMLKKSLGEAYDSLQSSKPGVQDQLKKLNKSYAQYKTLESASTASSASEGIFTPPQTIRAAAKGNKGSVSRGKGLLQDESELSLRVLGKAYPDSGTAGRMQQGNLARELLGSALAVPGELLYSPRVPAFIMDKTGKAKRSFQGTRVGSGLTNQAPAITRAILAPNAEPNVAPNVAQSPEEATPPPTQTIAHGGLVQRYNTGGAMPMGMSQPMMGMQQPMMPQQVMPYMQQSAMQSPMQSSMMHDPMGITNQALSMQSQFSPKPLQSSASAGNDAGYASGGMINTMFPMQQPQQISPYPYSSFNPMMGMNNGYAGGGPLPTDVASLMRSGSINKGASEDMPAEYQAIADAPSIASMKPISAMPAIKRKHSKIKLPSLIEAYKKVQADNAPEQSILDTSSLS